MQSTLLQSARPLTRHTVALRQQLSEGRSTLAVEQVRLWALLTAGLQL